MAYFTHGYGNAGYGTYAIKPYALGQLQGYAQHPGRGYGLFGHGTNPLAGFAALGLSNNPYTGGRDHSPWANFGYDDNGQYGYRTRRPQGYYSRTLPGGGTQGMNDLIYHCFFGRPMPTWA